jgi:hypothetical protein
MPNYGIGDMNHWKVHKDPNCIQCKRVFALQKQHHLDYLNSAALNPAVYGQEASDKAKQELKELGK